MALIVFGAVFVLLFIGFAVAQGIGSPSVPSGDVATVEDAPDGSGTISEDDFNKALEQQASQAKLKETPKPGDPKFDELKNGAMEELLNEVWLKGQAEELGITATGKEIETELEKIKQQSFPTPKAYKKFLKESHLTQEEVDQRVELQILSKQIQAKVNEEAPPPSSSAIADYYNTEKEAKFTTEESRDVRVISTEDKSKVEAARRQLEKDHSPASWKKVAAKYSSDPSSKSKGGLSPGIQEKLLPEQLKKPIFGAATGELIGPIKVEKNYLELEVVKLNPAKVKSLAEAESEISTTLGQEKQQEYFAEFVSGYQSKWRSRTHCASGFVTEQCANFKGSGHPPTAPPGCYEADPQTPASECPAPVIQTKPALPGTVTSLKPKGEPLAQRPLPEAPEEGGATVPPPGAGAPAPSGE